MNFKEITDMFKELNITKSDFAYDDFDHKPFGTIKTVNRRGGEGRGEDWNVVKYFVDHDVYISLDGYYSSYDGTDFYGFELEEVFPKEKTITVYETK